MVGHERLDQGVDVFMGMMFDEGAFHGLMDIFIWAVLKCFGYCAKIKFKVEGVVVGSVGLVECVALSDLPFVADLVEEGGQREVVVDTATV